MSFSQKEGQIIDLKKESMYLLLIKKIMPKIKYSNKYHKNEFFDETIIYQI